MIEYNNKKIFFEGKELDFKGLNTSHIIWHLQEMYRPERFLSYYGAKRVMPTRIHAMTLAEGVDFDALLIDNNMFRYKKLSEEDRNEVQEYINKSAFATALLKLNECSQVIGSGLEHDFNESEMYKYLSSSYDKLFENTYVTNERGRLIESFGSDSKIGIYEGENLYIRGTGDKRVAEDWSNHFSYDKLYEYHFDSVRQDGDCTIAKFITKEGQIYEAWFLGSNAKLVETGINLKHFLRKADLLESFRVGTLVEYHQPFTLSESVLLEYSKDGDKLKLLMMDRYGNRGVIYATLNIPVDEFIKKYKKDMDSIFDERTFEDRLDVTSEFLEKCQSDVASFSKIKNREIIDTDDDGYKSALSYKVKGLTPDQDAEDVVVINKKDKTKFQVLAVDNEGRKYNINYQYTGDEPIQDVIPDLNIEADDYDFTKQSEVYSFYRMLMDYGICKGSYPRGISTASRNYQRNNKEEGEIMEGEGVQVSDIAPKTDQNVGLVKVKMKKKKKVTESEIIDFDKNDLLINTINEQDEFYGSRGFIKDEHGHYHFNDFYICEGKAVHKSKLPEGYFSEGVEIHKYLVTVQIIDGPKTEQKTISTTASSESQAKHQVCDSLGLPVSATIEVKDEGLADKNKFKKEVYKESNLKDYYVPKYRCVSAGYETIATFDSKEEAISFAKENKQVCSILVDYYTDGKLVSIGTNDIWSKYDESNLTEDKAAADEAYYKVNDVALKLQEVKPFIKDGTEADKLYNNIVIELNSLQMSLYNEGLNESQNKDVDYKILDKQNDPEDFVTKDIPDDKLPVDLAKQGKCPYCAGPMSDEEYRLYGMCSECWDNGVE